MTGWSRLAGTAVLAVGLAGCGGRTHPGPVFNDQGQASVTCMTHQKHAPTPAYTPGAGADTEKLFALLHYYTANGNRPYCDGHGATRTDRAWLTLYTRAGANPANVARNTAGGPA